MLRPKETNTVNKEALSYLLISCRALGELRGKVREGEAGVGCLFQKWLGWSGWDGSFWWLIGFGGSILGG